MFSKFDKVKVTHAMDSVHVGMVGTVLLPGKDRGAWSGVQFKGFDRGHSLDLGVLPNGSKDGYYVPDSYLELLPRLKVGDWVKVLERHDAAKPGMVGRIVFDPSTGLSDQPYSVQFPGWKDGHDLQIGAEDEVVLVGEESVEGQFIPGAKLEKVRKPYTRKPKALVSDTLTPQLKELPDTKHIGLVRTLKQIKTQDGKSIPAGEYFAQAVKVSGRPMVLISFGYGSVLILEQNDKRLAGKA